MTLTLLTALSALIPAAHAQDQSIDIERFKPPADHFGYLNTESAETLGHLQVELGAWVNYQDDPLVLVNAAGERVEVVAGQGGPLKNRVGANANLGIGFTDYASLTLDLPVVLSQSGFGIQSLSDLAQPPEISGSALGDLRVIAKVAPVSRDNMPLGVALSIPVTMPTGSGALYAGDEGWSVAPTLAVEFSDESIWKRDYRWRGAVNIGYLVRSSDRLRDVEVSSAVLYKGAFGYRVADPVEIMVDVWGQSWGAAVSQNPIEAALGGKLLLGKWTAVNLGFGTAVVPGVGAPDFRVIAGVSFAPSFDPDARDADKDGISDGMDQCPKQAEDLDGFQDEDGCPELDNDGDAVDDEIDQCPNDPEDDDDFRDLDGCPDEDNDQDGILDLADRCPNEAETPNGYQDEDGCPDDAPIEDGDGDGFNDDVDRCPYDAEDADGFEDNDGCPDEDNDKDGILDVDDECPDHREVYNAIDDEDGCPDEGRVELKDDRIEILEKVFFDTGKDTIKAESYALLDEVAAVIIASPQIEVLRVEGHTDADGDETSNLRLSQARAKAVMRYLVKAGVEQGRLTSVGFGEGSPIADNDSEAGKSKNRRVEFIIVKMAPKQ